MCILITNAHKKESLEMRLHLHAYMHIQCHVHNSIRHNGIQTVRMTYTSLVTHVRVWVPETILYTYIHIIIYMHVHTSMYVSSLSRSSVVYMETSVYISTHNIIHVELHHLHVHVIRLYEVCTQCTVA